MMFRDKNGKELSAIQWMGPTERTDGTAYGAEDHAGYELGVYDVVLTDYKGWVTIPDAYQVNEWPLSELNLNEKGSYSIALRTVDKGGRVSVWSDPLYIEVTDARPKQPTGFRAF